MPILFLPNQTLGAYDQTNADYVRGTEILRQFYKKASEYPDWPYKTFNDFWYGIGEATTPPIKIHILAEGLGLQANVSEMSKEDTKEAMETLANAGAGRVPAQFSDFTNALTRRATEFNFLDAISHTAQETASEVTDIVSETGKGGIMALKAGKYLVPVLVWGGAAVALYMAIRAFAGGFEKVSGAVAKRIESKG